MNKKRFLVRNRESIQTTFPNEYYIVTSISDKEENFVNIPDTDKLIDHIHVAFGDVDGKDHLDAITEDKAKQICQFVEKNVKKSSLLIFQCDAGISRSAGCAAAFSKIINDNDNNIICYYPSYNRYVYRQILDHFMSNLEFYPNILEFHNKNLRN